MDISAFDLLLLFILAMVLALIIGLNVIFVIDKKLSDVVINVPKCPIPNIILQTDDKMIKGKIISNNINENYKNENYNNEGFNNIEGFETMNTSKNNNNLGGYSNNSVLLSDGKISNIHFNANPRPITHRCAQLTSNQNISNTTLRKNDGTICPDDFNLNNDNYYRQTIVGADGKTTTQNVNLYVPRTYLGGHVLSNGRLVRGGNFSNKIYEKQADVDQIGSIPVNNYRGEPIPIDSLAGM